MAVNPAPEFSALHSALPYQPNPMPRPVVARPPYGVPPVQPQRPDFMPQPAAPAGMTPEMIRMLQLRALAQQQRRLPQPMPTQPYGVQPGPS